MRIWDNFFNLFKTDISSTHIKKQEINLHKCFSPEESVIYEQEQSNKQWHGVPLSELSKIAQTTYRGKYVTVDEYNFLVFHYSSKSRKTNFHVQCTLDENRELKQMPHGYYQGQHRDSSDEFIEKANKLFSFI